MQNIIFTGDNFGTTCFSRETKIPKKFHCVFVFIFVFRFKLKTWQNIPLSYQSKHHHQSPSELNSDSGGSLLPSLTSIEASKHSSVAGSNPDHLMSSLGFPSYSSSMAASSAAQAAMAAASRKLHEGKTKIDQWIFLWIFVLTQKHVASKLSPVKMIFCMKFSRIIHQK